MLSMLCMLKKNKYIVLILENITQIVKNKLYFQWFQMENFLHFFETENKREFQKKVCENKDFCNILMPAEDNKII